MEHDHSAEGSDDECSDPSSVTAVEAGSVADIRAAILAARGPDLPIAVRCTGHGSLVDPTEALLISTASMTGVDLDPVREAARVVRLLMGGGGTSESPPSWRFGWPP